jgi:hypothetical protein
MRRTRQWALVAATLAGGTLFQSCGLGTVTGLLTNFNPCLTILVCNPAEYRLITSGLDGPGADPDKSPFCTFPPFCDADDDPLYGGILGAP